MMLIFKIILFSALFIFLNSAPTSPETKSNTGKAEKLGEEFQQQAPWFREKEQSGGHYGMPQPEGYLAPPKKEQEAQDTQFQRPLCYNPYTWRYEYCYPADSDYFLFRFRSPKFRFWWEYGRTCPGGYYFVPGQGCYRY